MKWALLLIGIAVILNFWTSGIVAAMYNESIKQRHLPRIMASKWKPPHGEWLRIVGGFLLGLTLVIWGATS